MRGGGKTQQHPQGFPHALVFTPHIVYPLMWGQISQALVLTLHQWYVWQKQLTLCHFKDLKMFFSC